MATLKQATANAIAFARETLGEERTRDIRVEEIEPTTAETGKPAWRLTLSMRSDPTPSESVGSLADLVEVFSARRDYRTFTVLKDSGEVESMKLRQLADA
jgi:hypothetical protein